MDPAFYSPEWFVEPFRNFMIAVTFKVQQKGHFEDWGYLINGPVYLFQL